MYYYNLIIYAFKMRLHLTHYFSFDVGFTNCCSVYGAVWCEDEVRSANCTRTMVESNNANI